jgi:peptidoglycan/xylan/chitin deacetylase (PgdA/CDA1 family)
LAWEQLRRLSREGLTIASHTRNHPAIPTLTLDQIGEEIRLAHADLKRELGEAFPLFAFPFGLSDPRALAPLQAQGIVASFTAFTRTPALNVLGQVNPLLLRREAVNGSAPFIEFCLSLTSAYAYIQSRSFVQTWRGRLRQGTGPSARLWR